MYRARVDWAPAYELVASLEAYAASSLHRTLECGSGWFRGVREVLGPDLAAEIAAARLREDADLLDLLVMVCPGERDVDSFLGWLGDLSAGELYECVAPHVPERHVGSLHDLGATRDRVLRLLAAWNLRYFDCIDPAILRGLEADAAARRALVGTMSAPALVEAATNGIEFDPVPVPEVVVLVPQYHYRPWNIFAHYRTIDVIQYPVDALPAAPGEPAPRVMRTMRALGDESRMKILHFLAREPRSFTDVVRLTGLSKSTVNHHLVVLRAASLVRVHVRKVSEKSSTYSLRLDAIAEMADSVRAYLTDD